MSLIKKLSEKLKALAMAAASRSGLWTLCVTSAGELVRTGFIDIDLTPRTVDADEITWPCVYGLTSSSTNIPSAGEGTLFINLPVASYGYQFSFRSGTEKFYFRTKMGSWKPWKGIQLTDL